MNPHESQKPAGESRGHGPGRRSFLGLCACAGLGTAACAHTAARRPPRAADSHRPEAERDRSGAHDWRVGSLGPPDAVAGYTDRVSVTPGQECGLHVSTTASSFRVSAYRVGWYGGRGARLVWRSEPVRGRVHPASRTPSATRTVRADWPRTLTLGTEGWPEGAYLLRLDADHGHQRYVPLIVRSTHGAGRTVLLHAPATWQAYNRWGGASLYNGASGAYRTRSLAVSFDRPYDANGAEKFLVYEWAAVVLAERLGLPLAYTTGTDLHHDPGVLRGATALICLGHDEYWTPQQRGHVTAARDAGTNVAFLGANTCYRRIRLEDGEPGAERTVVCYKSSYRSDPCYPSRPALVTTDFRQGPAADPESSLTGVLYEGYPVDAPHVVHAADHWLYEGTGVRPGESFDHLVGVEYDRVTPGAPVPEPLEITAHSPLVCAGDRSHSDSAYYTAPGGAGVFATGTMRWVEALMAGTPEGGRDHGMDARTRVFVTRTTENLLRAFAEGPAARHRPAPRPNTRQVYRTARPGRHLTAGQAERAASRPA
ncbi:N,N-dimethylformamidase beta subunit family domain-containing protein [Streptomyces kebangsaanensis]|uniref:N,N-dimethylformamidase beta subunit family domain-containing protein n=1 Tax=Streptomyces kebangsaanensis TaxID=864058 RepID=UPI000AC96B7C|nr:N,N-dimethylformamidase beta subunit family domain-containing protein [Streptomyces kebangsaanensis]